jgi:type II secretory pathway pseudopilin PulG
VELLVVIALGVILVSIGVPTYQRFQAKARQVQGKVVLSAIYNAERMTFLEFGAFTPCLGRTGMWEPQLNQKGAVPSLYAQGFKSWGSEVGECTSFDEGACVIKLSCGDAFNTVQGGIVGVVASEAGFSAAQTIANPIPATAMELLGTQGGPQAFTAGVTGNISASNTEYDAWTIDQNQNLVNVRSGL